MKINSKKNFVENSNTKAEDLYKTNILKEWIKELLMDYSKYHTFEDSTAAKKLNSYLKNGNI